MNRALLGAIFLIVFITIVILATRAVRSLPIFRVSLPTPVPSPFVVPSAIFATPSPFIRPSSIPSPVNLPGTGTQLPATGL